LTVEEIGEQGWAGRVGLVEFFRQNAVAKTIGTDDLDLGPGLVGRQVILQKGQQRDPTKLKRSRRTVSGADDITIWDYRLG
jgi:hypothetical protein